MSYEPDYSTERVSRYRRHTVGDHSQRDPYANCKAATKLWDLNESHLFAAAIFEELRKRRVSAKKWFGDGYADARELADAEIPDYDYLPREIDSLTRLRAKHAINSTGSQLFP